jgi:UDP-2,3-diacylglucosamine hydrolase
MCGAGVLPARMAAEARRQDWRVVAFTFADAPGLDASVDRAIPSRFAEIGPVLDAIRRESISAALFSGKFWLSDVLKTARGDAAGEAIAARAGSLTGGGLAQAVVATLGALGVEVLDQRAFVGDWLGEPGVLASRAPRDVEWSDIRRGLVLARRSAEAGVGQTVVIKRGVVTAIEAVEGTTAAIRRGGELAGPGAVAVKAVALDNDYRFDAPTIGVDTIDAAAASGVGVIAVEARRVLIVDRAATIAAADRARIALVSIDAERESDDAAARPRRGADTPA